MKINSSKDLIRGGNYVKEISMYQLTLSLKERQELVQALKEKIEVDSKELSELDQDFKWASILRERIAHLENIKLKVEQAKISPVKGLTE